MGLPNRWGIKSTCILSLCTIELANELERIEREQRMEELKESIQKARIHDEQQLILSRGPTTGIFKELGL